MVSGINRTAHTAHTPDATVPSRRARYPPASRTNASPRVVAGPGLGSPVAVSASASDNTPMPAAVQPANTATPVSSGQTRSRVLAADWPTVIRPGYGRSPATPALPGLASGALLTRLELAGDELVARDFFDVAAIPQNRPQFPPESDPAFGEIRGGCEQILIGDDLPG